MTGLASSVLFVFLEGSRICSVSGALRSWFCSCVTCAWGRWRMPCKSSTRRLGVRSRSNYTSSSLFCCISFRDLGCDFGSVCWPNCLGTWKDTYGYLHVYTWQKQLLQWSYDCSDIGTGKDDGIDNDHNSKWPQIDIHKVSSHCWTPEADKNSIWGNASVIS